MTGSFAMLQPDASGQRAGSPFNHSGASPAEASDFKTALREKERQGEIPDGLDSARDNATPEWVDAVMTGITGALTAVLKRTDPDLVASQGAARIASGHQQADNHSIMQGLTKTGQEITLMFPGTAWPLQNVSIQLSGTGGIQIVISAYRRDMALANRRVEDLQGRFGDADIRLVPVEGQLVHERDGG